jgi:hypothetical protein
VNDCNIDYYDGYEDDDRWDGHWDGDYDDRWDGDYDDDIYWCYYVSEQESIVKDYIYSGELLISEIRQQDSKMYVLASSYMLIADIDCGEDIVKPLKTLADFVSGNGGSFRVYKTKNGMRYLQTDLLYQGANKSAIATLEALGSDPKYVNWCKTGHCFMARLTPKIQPELALKYFIDRRNGLASDIAVCHFLKDVGSVISPNLIESINLHDFLTLPRHEREGLRVELQ